MTLSLITCSTSWIARLTCGSSAATRRGIVKSAVGGRRCVPGSGAIHGFSSYAAYTSRPAVCRNYIGNALPSNQHCLRASSDERRMGFRKTGTFHPAEEVLVLTCDVCERDIGHEDGRRPRRHLRVTQHPNAGAMDDQAPAIILCSQECLRAYAARLTGLDRSQGPKS